MTKRILIFIILGTFLFPVYGSFGGHDFQHAMHVVYEAHHLKKNHEHPPHDHSIPNDNADKHPLDVTLASYLEDHDHGELQISSKKGMRFSRGPLYKANNNYTYSIENDPEIILSLNQELPVVLLRNDLYLKTQRLRIGL
ncbi:MAG: hypothetical protein HOJ48_04945 [Desulfobacula sp.]|jgi:hypothetical protein|nr:hypothetical protein [Desulfobacula sp.]